MNYPRFSKNQRKAAEILLGEGEDPGSLTLRECAERAGVGQATVVRMLERAGYESWAEFQKTFWMEQGRQGEDPEHIVPESPGRRKRYEGIVHTIENDVTMIQDMMRMLDLNCLEEVVRIIKRAQLIDVYGTDNSANAAAELSGRLLHLGLTSRNYSELFFQKIGAGHLGNRDVAVGFSGSGSTKAVVDAIMAAHSAGAVTVAVTGDPESELAGQADYVFVTPICHTNEVSRWISSRISQIAFVDALCAAILDSDRERFSEMLTKSAQEFAADLIPKKNR